MNDFEKRLSDIATGFNKRINMPDSNQLLISAKSNTANIKSPYPIWLLVKKNIAVIIAVIVLSGTFLTMISYYFTHGPINRGADDYKYYPDRYPLSLKEFNKKTLKENQEYIDELKGKKLSDSELEELFEEFKEYGIAVIETREHLEKDSDEDGLPDWIESVNHADLLNIYDYSRDVTNNVLDPNNKDSDGDGLYDGVEIIISLNPLKSNAGDCDTDSDGICDMDELLIYGTDPTNDDTDIDGLSDYDEIFKYHTNPIEEDTDSDGINDKLEINIELDPTLKDSDKDGIPDSEEEVEYTIDEKEQGDTDVKVSVTVCGKPKNFENENVSVSYDNSYILFTETTKGYIAGKYSITLNNNYGDSYTESESDIESDNEYYINFELSGNKVAKDGVTPAIYYIDTIHQQAVYIDDQTSSGNKYSAKVSKTGYYMLLDKAEWDRFWRMHNVYWGGLEAVPDADEAQFPFTCITTDENGNFEDYAYTYDWGTEYEVEITNRKLTADKKDEFYTGINPIQNYVFRVSKLLLNDNSHSDKYITISCKEGYDELISDYKIMYCSVEDYKWREAEYTLSDDRRSAIVTVSDTAYYCVCYK